ncbi:uncharacterized protein Z518_10318 [Rhinocladiella mackenziei CBS 650.93]|uniref:Rhinocladiella mackenziei CBS 650.93 unplaced genomic scaffold supercont1.9, whole genome shotgun sequence n=1 Tax=Rhinocladiella mackenziei CBS 650.93 TaxID=1442369 RepID=A0A0D2ITW0_9EURO|nr:uncharacterized protein Z518_10318 [Rhinocladiella mackenziei CBS 650.93]KIX00180.1 hypothetical protein Z518_10318 [Rhinocladiella mackenziei CBS 650.93]
MTKSTVTYGRGGAGNVTNKTDASPAFEPQSTPTLKSKTYTTGRGGTGNMTKNDFEHPEAARRSQDVEIPGIILPEGSHHTGRGGAANTYTPTENEKREARTHNEKVRSESFNRDGSKERTRIRAIADKAKDTLTGQHSSEREA